MTPSAIQAYFTQFAGDDVNNHALLGERTAIDVMNDRELWRAVKAGSVRVISKIFPRGISKITSHPYYSGGLVVHYQHGSTSEIDPRFTVIVQRIEL